MAHAEKTDPVVEVVEKVIEPGGVTLHMSIEEAKVLKALLGHTSCRGANPLNRLYRALYHVLPGYDRHKVVGYNSGTTVKMPTYEIELLEKSD